VLKRQSHARRQRECQIDGQRRGDSRRGETVMTTAQRSPTGRTCQRKSRSRRLSEEASIQTYFRGVDASGGHIAILAPPAK